MKIALYISDLLYEHECVVIPGLGGFISKDHGAQIHPLKHQFKPPSREIVFNPHLRANDGLLLSLIARSENISYQDAKSNLDRFVHKCIDGLNKGHRINFRNIGSLAYNQDKQIVFHPDENQNFMASSFGLSSFVSPAIIREGFPEKIENKIFKKNHESVEATDLPKKTQVSGQKNQKKPDHHKTMVASKRPNPYVRQLMFIGALVVMMGIGWAYMNKHVVQRYYNAYAGLVPFFYSSPNDYIAVNSEKFPLEKILPKVKVSNSPESETAITQPNTIENNLETVPMNTEITQDSAYQQDTASLPYLSSPSDIDTIQSQTKDEEAIQEVVVSTPEPEVVISKPQGPQYLIIAGAFREKSNADKLILDLQAKGFTAEHIGQNKRGLWMVSIERFDFLEQARERLNVIRKDEQSDYWLLKV
jgi:cell division septation protein DedD